MDITAASSAAATAPVQNSITLGLITSTSSLEATQVAILMASLGVGNNVDSYA